MTVAELADDLAGRLRSDNERMSRRVAKDIVASLVGVSRSWPALNGDTAVEPGVGTAARKAARLLNEGAPFAYAVGCAQFRHLSLRVDQRVLIPRPETEVLVTEILARMDALLGPTAKWGTAIDIGTGSGAIALSLAGEGRFDRVIATDVSLDALDVARMNFDRVRSSLTCATEFRCGSLARPVRGEKATLLVSNPPYVAFSELASLPPSVRNWEPPLALASGDDGMAATLAIISAGAVILASGGILALEVDERRASRVADAALSDGHYDRIEVRLDLAGRDRFVFASRIRNDTTTET